MAAACWGGGRQQDVGVVASRSSSGTWRWEQQVGVAARGRGRERRWQQLRVARRGAVRDHRHSTTATSAKESIGWLQGHIIDLQNTHKEMRFRVLTCKTWSQQKVNPSIPLHTTVHAALKKLYRTLVHNFVCI